MIPRLDDRQMTEIYSDIVRCGYNTSDTCRGFQRIQIELQMRIIEELRRGNE
jgi:hypothetical protein